MESAGSHTPPQSRHAGHGAPQSSLPSDQAGIVIPPYWQQHQRTTSNVSVDKAQSAQITLEDHTDEGSEQCKALWAKHVSIDDYVVVSGTTPGVGAYVVWNCTVETLDGGPMKIMKRYSEFDDLRNKLVRTFPHAGAAMPPLPPKKFISRFRPRFLERRKAGLSYFLNCVLLNPEFSASPVLKEFLFS
ncbi:PX-domain-containing protein [Lophium mytilinum]|uniref:Endosomal/vacuolar adapter protein YPT35 n=1 Tax=Lophium mytilinum TaxID=390894 RepID=A0A6A6R5E7_9PEZI|nr:PX-domain-containing protein [Lophium mytilinum]